jgi:hypothetical protein
MSFTWTIFGPWYHIWLCCKDAVFNPLVQWSTRLC